MVTYRPANRDGVSNDQQVVGGSLLQVGGDPEHGEQMDGEKPPEQGSVQHGGEGIHRGHTLDPPARKCSIRNIQYVANTS